MSERFPDFDVTRISPAYGKRKPYYRFRSKECTMRAETEISHAVTKAAPDSDGQSLWADVRTIILGMVSRGEIVRVGLTWDIP